MLNPLNSTMIAVALIPIGRSYHVGVAATAWLVASLYLASAIAQPVLGEIGDRLGARRVYAAGLAVVGIAGLGGAFAPSLWLLVVVRVAIGIGTSAAYPAAISMVRQQSRRLGQEAPGGVLGALSIGSLVSAAIGPALGGVLVGVLGGRSIFVVNAPPALTGLALTFRWLPADQPALRRTGDRGIWRALDAPGIVAFGAALTVLLVFLRGAKNPDWKLLAGSVVLGAVLAGWELRARRPFLDLRMLAANRPLVITYIRYGLTFLIIYGMLYGFPQWMEQVRGLSPQTAGLVLLPGSVVAGICAAAGSRGRRIRGPLLIGTGVLLSASAALLTVGAGSAVVVLITVGVLFGIPNGLNVVANQAAMYRQAPAGQPGVASGLFRTAQYIGAIFAASLIGLVYGRHASDGGLHGLALAFLALSAVLLGGTVLDPTIRRRDSAVQTATGTPPGAGASGTRNLRSGGRAGTAEREKR